jgi:RNA polymerase sigma-70 factor (ECF subfamily)
VVLAAKDKASPDSAAALEALCRAYWYPLYAFVRRQGHSPCDAQDLTQGFFARLLEKDYLAAAAREKGRFRTFLRVALKRFLANEWDHARRLKRGGGHTHFPLETETGEERYQAEGSDGLPPDRLYERRWAMTLLEQTLARLRAEHTAAGKTAEFERLKGVLMADRGSVDYGALGEALGMNEGAARVAVHRLRKRFRQLFRAAVADTVSAPEEVEGELRYLVGVLGES